MKDKLPEENVSDSSKPPISGQWLSEELGKYYDSLPMPLLAWYMNESGKFVAGYMNKAVSELINSTPRLIINKPVNELFYDRADIIGNIRQCFDNKVDFTHEVNDMPWLFSSKEDVRITYNYVEPGIVTQIFNNITKQKHAIKAEQDSKEQYYSIFEAVDDGLIFTDNKGTVLDVNNKFLEITELKREDVIDKKAIILAKQFINLRNIPKLFKIITDNLSGKQHGRFELEYRNKTLLIDTTILSKKRGVIGILRDITKSKTINRKISESEERNRLFFDNVKSCVAIYSAYNKGEDFEIVDINKAGLKSSNLTSKEGIIGKKVTEVFPGVVELGLFDVFREVYETGEAKLHPMSEYSDNRIVIWVENYVFKLPSGLIVAIYDDVSAEKQAELLLQQTHKQYQQLFETTPVAMLLLTRDMTVYDANNQACKLYNYKRSDLVGMELPRLTSEKALADVQKYITECVESNSTIQFIHDAMHSDSSAFVADTIASSYAVQGDKHVIMMVSDVSEKQAIINNLKITKHSVDKANMAIVWLNKNGRVIYANDIACYMLEYKQNDLLKKHIWNIDINLMETDWEKYTKEIRAAGSFSLEAVHVSGAGKNIPVIVKTNFIKSDNNVIYFLYINDISDIKKYEEEILAQEDRLRKIFNTVPIGMIIMDKEIRIVSVNNAIRSLIDKKNSDIIRTRPGDGLNCIVTYGSDQACGQTPECVSCPIRSSIRKVLQNRQALRNIEINPTFIINEQLQSFWYEMNAEPIIIKNERHVLLSLVDITSRKETETALRMSEEKYRLIVENQNDLIVKIDENFRLQYVNPQYCKTFGISETELIGKQFLDLIHPDDRTDVIKSIVSLKEPPHQTAHEERAKTENGWKWFFWSNRAVVNTEGDIEEIIAIGRDITKRKRAEEALNKRILALTSPVMETETIKFTDLFNLTDIQTIQDAFANATGVASIITDVEGEPITQPSNFSRLCSKYIRTTEKGSSNCKLSDKELGRLNLSGPTIQPCLSGKLYDAGASITVGDKHIANWLVGQIAPEPVDLDQIREYAIEIGQDPEMMVEAAKEIRIMPKEQFEAVANALYLIANHMSLLALQNYQQAKDIHNRQEIEAKLKEANNQIAESEAKYRKLIENTFAAFYILQDNIIVYSNKRMAEIAGYEGINDILGMDIRELIEPALKQQNGNIDSINKDKDYSHYETTLKTNDDSIIDVEIIESQIYYQNNPAIQGTLIDITERKRVSEQMAVISKLESIGRLAGGIAHNFKNLLTTMSLSIELASLKPQSADRHLQKVIDSIDKATTLATRFQTFSSGGDPVKEKININRVVEESVSITLNATNSECILNLDKTLPMVNADPRQIEEVFTNLIMNADEAMPKGGQIEISTNSTHLTNDSNTGLKENDYVAISIKDQGHGIPSNILNDIFTPFFSTRDRGHGLGLSSAHFIVQKHNGAITVSSKVDHGSEFNIYLPVVDKPEQKPAHKRLEIGRDDNKIKILLMDDNTDIRDNFEEIAEDLNINLSTASDGYLAIEKYEEAMQKSIPFDIVILDLTIVGSDLGGDDVLKKLQLINPDVKAIVFSGHSTKPIVANYSDYGFAGRIIKPINIQQFISEINRVFETIKTM